MRVSYSQKTVENSRKVQELAFSQLLALGFCNPECIKLSLSLQLGFLVSVIQFFVLAVEWIQQSPSNRYHPIYNFISMHLPS